MKHWNLRVKNSKASRHSVLYAVRGNNRQEAIRDFCKAYPKVAAKTWIGLITVAPSYGGFDSYRGGFVQQ